MFTIIYSLLIAFIIISIGTLNVILTKECRERELTFKEIIKENRKTKIGRIFMSILAFPTAITLQILTLKKIDTKSIYEIPKGHFIYLEEEGMFGTFAFNIYDYLKISNKLQINTEVNDDIDEYIIVKPKTLDGLCSMIDITNKLGLKQINE